MNTNIFILGFVIFAMFFGSGNLIFPLKIGQQTDNLWIFGFLGILLSGIILPFAGVFAVKRFKGSYYAFFDDLGVGAKILVPLVILCLLGSFGVVPRCVTVAYGGVSTLFPSLPLWLFSAGFIGFCFSIGLKDSHLMTILGQYITPVKIISIAIIIVCSIYQAPPLAFSTLPLLKAAEHGLVEGYQTMDLFAGFFFSAFIFKHIENKCKPGTTENEIFWTSAKASLIGAIAIALAYAGLIYLGASYKHVLINVPPTHALPTITKFLFNTASTVIITITMLASCLATAVTLNNLFAQFLQKLFNNRLSKCVVLGCTSGVAFMMSLLNFSGITTILIPILDTIYPGIIVYTLINLVHPNQHVIKRVAFYGITAFMIAIILCT